MLSRCPAAASSSTRGPFRGRGIVVAGTLALVASIATADAPSPILTIQSEADRRNALVAEVNRLRKELRACERALETIDRPASAGATSAHAPSPTGGGSTVLRKYTADTPSSSLDRAAAFRTAILATQFVPGARISAVAGTGSMEPVFGLDAYLLMEPAPFDTLQEGDIVTYRTPGSNHPIVHRLVRKYGDKFVAKGDNNPRADPSYVTRENYAMRVFGLVYTRRDETALPATATTADIAQPTTAVAIPVSSVQGASGVLTLASDEPR